MKRFILQTVEVTLMAAVSFGAGYAVQLVAGETAGCLVFLLMLVSGGASILNQ